MPEMRKMDWIQGLYARYKSSWQMPTDFFAIDSLANISTVRDCRRLKPDHCFSNLSQHINGFTLVEVMVSIVLLTISMLGLAALQNSSTRFDHQAFLRSQSVIQMTDIVDRMRANNGGVVGGYYTPNPVPDSYARDCGDSSQTCSPQELAVFDIVKWKIGNLAKLPNGTGTITALGGNIFEISVLWEEQDNEKIVGGGFVNPCDGSSNENLHCNQLVVRL
jgi:type IV pilus assembly protein PilV